MKEEAKNKAKELVWKYLPILEGWTDKSKTELAKQCAIIAVEEIINNSPSLPILGDGGYLYEDIDLSIKFWQQVKEEINLI